MASVVNVTNLTGGREPVFDLVTSARFWPAWHPATQAVFGVTERPYQLGDVVHERVHFGGVEFTVTWQVVEHVRPCRVVLQALARPTRITYGFEAREGTTEFRRELEYDEALARQIAPGVADWGQLMHAQSEEGLQRLKALVEGIFQKERTAPPTRDRGGE